MIGKIFTALAATLAALLIYVYSAGCWPCPTVYTAPTLWGITEELSRSYPLRLDVRVLGSALAAQLIRSGHVPDLFLTVDHELVGGLPGFRRELVLGTYSLQLVCGSQVADWVDGLKRGRLGLADPNIAPIGYRALAAIYLLDKYGGLGILDEVEENLNIRFVGDGQVFIDASAIRADGRFYMRKDLAEVGALLEGGTVDCIFAHAPFVSTRRLDERYRVFEMPEYARFDDEPPIEMVVGLAAGYRVRVGKFLASAASFTEEGDRLLSYIAEVDLEKYQITPMR